MLALHSRGKSMEESSDNECSNDNSDNEALAPFVHKCGKIMKKKGYHTSKTKDYSTNKEYVKLSYKCKSLDHVVVECP